MSGDYKFDTLSLHAGHVPDERHGSRAVPIHQTTSYVFKDTEHAAALYNMELGGNVYTRISNPTVAVLEQRIAALEGGVAATATASGMAALAVAMMTICSKGDHIVASSRMYGANINLLENTLPRFGITTSFVDPTNVAAIEAAIQPNTKIVFGEVIGNPGLDIMDVEAVAKITAKAGVPLMLDCTFNTPWLLKPFELGANIIIHSLTKWIGGHGIAIAGAVVDGGNFNWDQNDKFPSIAGPHYAMDSINSSANMTIVSVELQDVKEDRPKVPENAVVFPLMKPEDEDVEEMKAEQYSEQEEDIDEATQRVAQLLKISVEELELSVRSANCLKAADIVTLEDLVVRTESEMLKLRNFGWKSLNELNAILEELGLSFGMKIG